MTTAERQKRNVFRIWVLGLAALAVSGCVGSLTIEDRFRQVAVYDEETGEEWPILKRSEDIRLYVAGATAADLRQIDALSQQITEATGLAVIPQPDDFDANVELRFVSTAEWRAFQAKERYPSDCAVDFFDTRSGDPLAIILIPDSLRGNTRAECVAQEFAHSTGLTFDTNGRRDTVFGGWAGATELTPIDFALLRILYDDRLVNGMTWAEARPHVQAIIAEMEAAGEL